MTPSRPKRPSRPPAKSSTGRAAKSAPVLSRPLVLIGMMGAGKTAIGRRLAERLAIPFIDTDHEVETAAHLSIPEIFRTHGEDAFRQKERQVLGQLLAAGTPRLIAVGGGAFMDADNRRLVAGTAISLWLRATPETLCQRLKNKKNRPLLENGNLAETVAALVERRYPVYQQADITIDVDHGSVTQIVGKAVEALEALLEKHGTLSPAGESETGKWTGTRQ